MACVATTRWTTPAGTPGTSDGQTGSNGTTPISTAGDQAGRATAIATSESSAIRTVPGTAGEKRIDQPGPARYAASSGSNARRLAASPHAPGGAVADGGQRRRRGRRRHRATRDLHRRALADAGQPVGHERRPASLHEPAACLTQLVGRRLPRALPNGGRGDLDVGGLRRAP